MAGSIKVDQSDVGKSLSGINFKKADVDNLAGSIKIDQSGVGSADLSGLKFNKSDVDNLAGKVSGGSFGGYGSSFGGNGYKKW